MIKIQELGNYSLHKIAWLKCRLQDARIAYYTAPDDEDAPEIQFDTWDEGELIKKILKQYEARKE